MSLVEDAKKYHETKTEQHGQRRRSMQTETITPRPSTVAKEVMVLVGGINGVFPNNGSRREASWLNVVLQSVEMYDSHKDKWHPLPDLPVPVSWYSVAALGNNMFVSGGILEGQVVNSLWRFESVHRDWSQVKGMVKPRARHASAAWNNKLYVLGGVDIVGEGRTVHVESIECYDMELDCWTVVGQSPMARKQSRVVPFNQTLVEIGGTQGGARLKTMESYNCSEQSCTYSGEQFILPECIQFAQIVVLNGVFYIVWEESKKLISLNPEKRMFRRLSDMHYAHVHSGATVLGGKLYVAGGLVDSKPSRIVEVYDPVTNCWTLVKSMKQARACHGCATLQMC
jgi:N-acetylneuraminic acid mutarotase